MQTLVEIIRRRAELQAAAALDPLRPEDAFALLDRIGDLERQAAEMRATIQALRGEVTNGQ